MSTQGYPEGTWAQHSPSFPQNKSASDVDGGETQGHAGPTQYNPKAYSSGPYEGHAGADACVIGDYKWDQNQYNSATEGKGSADTLPAFGALSMNRARVNDIEYSDPNAALVGFKMPFHFLGYASPQAIGGSAPISVPQPGTANDDRYIQDVADMPTYDARPTAPLDGHGASPLEISEGTGSASTNVESWFGAWTTSTVEAGEYGGQQQFPGHTHGVHSTPSPYDPLTPALSVASVNRAVTNDIPPQHAYTHPNFTGMNPQMLIRPLGYPNRQRACEHFMGRVPNLVPQRGPVDAREYVRHSGQGVGIADTFDGCGAHPLKISEGAGNGGTGAGTSVECENPWATTATAGEYSALHGFPGYTHAAQPPYDPRTCGCVGQDGIIRPPNFTQLHGSTAWSTQQWYSQSAPATGSAELPLSWGVSGMNVPFDLGQTQPILHGVLHPSTQGVGAYTYPDGFNTLSRGAPSGSPQQEGPFYTQPNVTGATVTPSHHQVIPQVIPATVANATGSSMAVAPAGGAGVAAPHPTVFNAPPRHMGTIRSSRMSKTRTGRNGPQRGVAGQTFENNLEKVQERLREEGADVGAVKCLRSEIFVDGKITRAALKADMTPDQRKGREGKQKYMLLLDVVDVIYPQSSQKERNHRCLLCPPWARAEFKLREDTLRHFCKAHFGLSFDCKKCNHKFWVQKEFDRHDKKDKCQNEGKGKGKGKGKGSHEELD